jgi:hypothetical protein
MGVLGTSCTSGGVFSSSATQSYIQGVIASRGVALPANSTSFSTTASCGSASGFSKVSISFAFSNIVPNILNAFGVRPTVSVAACFPNQPT